MKHHTINPRSRNQGGFVLVTALVVLLALTFIGLALFRSSGLMEKVAGNTLERQRAFESAQGAVQYGEWWLTQFDRGFGTSCASIGVASATGTSMQVCSDALANPTSVPWTNRFDYRPPGMAVASVGGLGGLTDGDINYAASPALYISYLGLTADGLTKMYRITGVGYGGRADTVSVIESTFRVSSSVKDLGGL